MEITRIVPDFDISEHAKLSVGLLSKIIDGNNQSQILELQTRLNTIADTARSGSSEEQFKVLTATVPVSKERGKTL